MPLPKGRSNKAVSEAIKILTSEGRPIKQAQSIAIKNNGPKKKEK